VADSFRVALLIESSRTFGRELLRGIASYSRKHGSWLFFLQEWVTGELSPDDTYPPQPDTPGVENYYTYGSAHANSLSMAFCDNSVQTINYAIDPLLHKYLSCRNDGQVIDPKKL
jgi:hypothetical protein